MTISVTQSVTTLIGNNVTVTFDFNFLGVAPEDIEVLYTDLNDIQVVLLTSQYTLFLNPAAPGTLWGIGGTVTPLGPMTLPLASGTFLTIRRKLPLTQPDSISNQGDFFPVVVERALDKLCMEIQQVSGRTGQLRGAWGVGEEYSYGDVVQDLTNGTNTLNYYMCIIANTSAVWADELAAGDWALAIDVAQIAAFAAAAQAAAAAALISETNAAASAAAAAASALAAAASAATATLQAALAAASAAAAANFAAGYSGTSTSNVLINTGVQTFQTQAGKLWVVGQFLQIASAADPTNFMHGEVTAYSGTTLDMIITDTGGAGFQNDWSISISGSQGPQGLPGIGFGTVTSVGFIGDNVIYEPVVTGAPITTTGTFFPVLKDQLANTVLAGPTAGPDAQPTFRALTAADFTGVTGTTLQAWDITLQAISDIAPINYGILTLDVQFGNTIATLNFASAFSLGMLQNNFASEWRTDLGLGTAAVLNVGLGANQIVQRDGTGAYPSGDGSAITGVTASITPASLNAAIGFSAYFDSGLIVWGNGTAGSFPHGFSGQPLITFLEAECIADDISGGYVVGERVQVGVGIGYGVLGGVNYWNSTTEVGWIVPPDDNGARLRASKKDGSGSFGAVPAKWSLRLQAWGPA